MKFKHSDNRVHIPKILFIWDGLFLGGMERRFIQLVKGLNKNGYGDLYLLMLRDELAYEEIKDCNIKITILHRTKPFFLIKLYKFIKSIKPDIIQTWSFMPMFYFNILYPILPYHPFYSISTAADCNYKKHSLIKRLVFRLSYILCDIIIGNSKSGLLNYHTPPKKSICIYNGFDMDRLTRFVEKDVRKELRINTKYVVTMMARFSISKDWTMFVNTAMNIIDRGVDVTFLAVGDGETLKSIKALVPSHYDNKLRFLGRRNDVEAILRITDVSVLCTNSSEHGEGLPNSILESFAFCVPAIATQSGGTGEILINNYNGYLISPHNEERLYVALMDLLKNPTKRFKMKTNAFQTVREKFTLEASTNKYINVFNRIFK